MKNHSDYWRKHFLQPDTQDLSAEEATEKKLEQCIKDVSRIVDMYDEGISIGYKTPKNPANDVKNKTIYLDPEIALSDQDQGQKVDIFAGELLLNSALRKINEGKETDYSAHVAIASKQDISSVQRAASLLYLSMEADAACSYIKEETPGLIEYAKKRAESYSSSEVSEFLEETFKQDEVSGDDLFCAIMHEFDTFSTMPLEYGKHTATVNAITDLVREKFATSEQRLKAAKHIAQKYVTNVSQEMLEQILTTGEMFGMQAGGTEKLESKSSIAQKQAVNKVNNKLDIISSPKIVLTENVKLSLGDEEAQTIYDELSLIVQPIADSIRDSLEILNHKQNMWDEYSLKSGDLDDGGLHKILEGTDNLFYKVEELPKQNIQVCLLIDESGSMGCGTGNGDSRFVVAQKLAIAFANAVKEINGVDLFIYGHAGPQPKCTIYKYLTPDTPESNYNRLSHIYARLHNYDGFAIQEVSEDLLAYDKEYAKRLMFVISDGEPSVTNYSGQQALEHVKGVISSVKEYGLDVYAIGVDEEFPQDDGAYMYGEGRFIALNDFDLHHTANIIASFLEEICKQVM